MLYGDSIRKKRSNVIVYYATYYQLVHQFGKNLTSIGYQENAFAHTDVTKQTPPQTMNYFANSPNPTPVSIYETNSAEIYVFIDANHIFIDTPDEGMDSFYPRLILHELGHALGWHGHIGTLGNVMYQGAFNSSGTISNADILHIRQLYTQ